LAEKHVARQLQISGHQPLDGDVATRNVASDGRIRKAALKNSAPSSRLRIVLLPMRSGLRGRPQALNAFEKECDRVATELAPKTACGNASRTDPKNRIVINKSII
jgi:hypothetical protein